MANDVQGLNQLRWVMTKKIPDAVEKAATEALEQGATEIVATMKRLVPIDSGALRDSIGWTWGDPPEGAMVLGGSKAVGGEGRREITIYAGNALTRVGSRKQFQLARLQEFGTKEMDANPFFFPAYRTLRRRVRSRITRNMKKAIRDVVK